ncbi:MAG: hypothetical protein M3P08_11055 [Thermoproteota archaeon]|nr:hypothetical protein [Thermoproteota archaeon]
MGPTSFKGNIGQGVAALGNATNAQPIGNATSTLKLSPLTGQQPQTQQTTGQHHHKGGNQGPSTSNGNSTGH